MPTLLDMLNIRSSNHAIGRSLLTEIEMPFAFFSNSYFDGWAGVRVGKHKLIYQFKNGRSYLYDLESDPLETINLATTNSQITTALKNMTLKKCFATQFLFEQKRIWKSSCGYHGEK